MSDLYAEWKRREARQRLRLANDARRQSYRASTPASRRRSIARLFAPSVSRLELEDWYQQAEEDRLEAAWTHHVAILAEEWGMTPEEFNR